MASAPENEVEFSWPKYMEEDGSLPAYDQSLFPHLRCSERRLSELILRPGRRVIVRRDNRLEHAKIELVFESKLYVSLNSSFECIDLDDVMPDNVLRLNGNRKNIEIEDASVSSESSLGEELTATDLELAHLTMAEAVKVGQFFELQDRINPCKVYIVKVLENRGGLLLVGRNGVKSDPDRPIRVFVTDERCHAIGWLESGAQTKLFFADGAEAVSEMAKKAPVAHWVFEHFRVREHKFQENMSLEVLQASNGGAFYAGHVTEIINSHYFTVRIAESLTGMEKTITCSKSHPQIFPSGWCQRHGLRLTPPSDYVGEEEFSMLVYEAKLHLKGKAPESLFDPPKTLYKPERLRNIEVLDIRTKNEMYPAKILRWMKHIVWVNYGHYTNATPPGVLSTRPCAYDKLEPVLPGVDRFGLRTTCTTHRTPVFIEREKRFLPAVYLDNDLMLPVLYFRKDCFCGPFLDPAKVKALPNGYPPGPMPLVMRSILADIISASYRPEDLSKLMSCSKDTSAPIVFAKSRVYGKPYRFRVECCESVSEFSGWLRNICLLLDACPELINIKDGPCTSFCQQLQENIYMKSDKHAWTANYQSMTTPPRRMRMESGNSVARANLPNKKRKKKEKLEVPEVRRPVTRAVLRKTIRSPRDEETKSTSSSPVKKEKASSAEPAKSPMKPLFTSKSTSKLSELAAVDLTSQDAAEGADLSLKRHSPNLAYEVEQVSGIKKSRKSPQVATNAITQLEEKVLRRKRKVQTPDSTVPHNSVPPEPALLPVVASVEARPVVSVPYRSTVGISSLKPGPVFQKKPLVQLGRPETTEPVPMPPITSNPITWDCAQLSDWLKQTDLGSFADLLAKDEVDGEAFMLLSLDECINTLKIKLGPAMKLESLRKGLRAFYESKYFDQERGM